METPILSKGKKTEVISAHTAVSHLSKKRDLVEKIKMPGSPPRSRPTMPRAGTDIAGSSSRSLAGGKRGRIYARRGNGESRQQKAAAARRRLAHEQLLASILDRVQLGSEVELQPHAYFTFWAAQMGTQSSIEIYMRDLVLALMKVEAQLASGRGGRGFSVGGSRAKIPESSRHTKTKDNNSSRNTADNHNQQDTRRDLVFTLQSIINTIALSISQHNTFRHQLCPKFANSGVHIARHTVRPRRTNASATYLGRGGECFPIS